MSVRLLVAALAIISAPPVARSADEENPFKNAKVGDYATYKMSVKFAGTTLGGNSTQSVTAKSEKEATVKTTGEFEFMGNKQEIPPQEQKIDLTKPFDPTKVGGGGGLPPGTDVKVEKGKEGKEKIKVGGKEYDCTWTIYKVSGKAGEHGHHRRRQGVDVQGTAPGHGQDGDDRRRRQDEDGDDDGTDRDRQQEVSATNDCLSERPGFPRPTSFHL